MAAFDDSDEEDIPTANEQSSGAMTARERLAAMRNAKIATRDEVKNHVETVSALGDVTGQAEVSEDDDIALPVPGRRARRAGRDSDEGVSVQQDEDGSLDMMEGSTKSGRQASEEEPSIRPRKRLSKTARQDTPTPSPRREASASMSPGLFVSPARNDAPAAESDDDDLPEDLSKSTRVLELAAKMRAERKAKEAEAENDRARQHSPFASDDDDAEDDDAGRRLTQQVQPTRKASKKAMEDMARETQRLARNHQLTYQPITKKTFTKASFFEKFNFRRDTPPSDPITSSSPTRPSDLEMHETPSTSPMQDPDADKTPTLAIEESNHIDSGSVTTRQRSISPSPLASVIARGKGRENPPSTSAAPNVNKNGLVGLTAIDSDDDLEIVDLPASGARAKLDDFLKKMPVKKTQASHSMQNLRILAHIGESTGPKPAKGQKAPISVGALQMSLQQKARQQAALERQERIQKLKDSGMIVQTTEEREKAMAQVEDMMARARRDDEELAKREKAAAKKERQANGETDPLGESSDDEDYVEALGEEANDISVSGSDDDSELHDEESQDSDESSDEEAEDESEETQAAQRPVMFDAEADESDGSEASEPAKPQAISTDGLDLNDEEDDNDTIKAAARVSRPRARRAQVISDDEDDDMATPACKRTLIPSTQSPRQQSTTSPAAPTSVLRSASKTFIPGVTVVGAAGLGLTQIFAGTMDESQGSPSQLPQGTSIKDQSMAFLRMQAPPSLPPFVPTMTEDTQDIITDSQPIALETQMDQETPIQLDYTQTQPAFDLGFDDSPSGSQFSDFGTPTQDIGFAKMTPIVGRFAEPPASTVETVLLDQCSAVPTTPCHKPQRKLRRKIRAASFSDDDNEEAAHESDEALAEESLDSARDAFSTMRKSAGNKSSVDAFNKKKSMAKDMVNEQAEESDDEYAGLGGASDDESGGEEDAFVREMIDDEAGNDADEGKLAAFFA